MTKLESDFAAIIVRRGLVFKKNVMKLEGWEIVRVVKKETQPCEGWCQLHEMGLEYSLQR